MTDSDETPETIDDTGDTGGGFPRWLKWGLLGALGLLVVFYGAIFIYTEFINDAPDELDAGDLDAALEITTDDESVEQENGEAVTSEAVTSEADDGEADSGEDGGGEDGDGEPSATTTPSTDAPVADEPAGSDEAWSVTDASELGYRVTEVLFGVDTEGVGRTNQITGSLVIEGTQVTEAEFVVDVASIESDDGRRDGQFRGRIMSTDEFPTATFTLTEPIELGTEAIEGATVETTASGDLTLRGVTNPVTFDVSARLENGRIGVLGNIPVVFADYEIANPSISGITTEDNGLLEFVLVFEQP